MRNTSVWQTLKKAFVFTAKNFRVFLKIILIPFVISVALEIGLEPGLGFMLSPVTIALLNSLWVSQWIRYYDNPSQSIEWICIGRQQLQYFNYALIFETVNLVVFLLFNYYSAGATWGSFLIAALISSPFIFVLPAIALGHPTSFKISYRQSKPVVRKIFNLYIFSYILFFGCMGIVGLIGLLLSKIVNFTFSGDFLNDPTLDFFSFFTHSVKMLAITQFYKSYRPVDNTKK